MSSLENDLRTLQIEVKRLREDVAKITETLADAGRDGQREARHRAQIASAQIAGDLGRTARAVVHEIEERPLTFAAATGLALAVALGIALGLRCR